LKVLRGLRKNGFTKRKANSHHITALRGRMISKGGASSVGKPGGPHKKKTLAGGGKEKKKMGRAR